MTDLETYNRAEAEAVALGETVETYTLLRALYEDTEGPLRPLEVLDRLAWAVSHCAHKPHLMTGIDRTAVRLLVGDVPGRYDPKHAMVEAYERVGRYAYAEAVRLEREEYDG